MRPIVLIALLAFVINSPYGVQAKSLLDLRLELETDKERCMRFAGVAEETMATVRGISVEEVCAEKADLAVEQREVRKKQREAERKARVEKARNQQIILLTAAAFIGTLVIVIVFRARRRITATISVRWRRQSKNFRAWAFSSFSWVVGIFCLIWLVDPYNSGGWSYMDSDEVLHMFGVMIVPPIFLGAVWFGYKRFVDIEATEVQPADYIAEPEKITKVIKQSGNLNSKAKLALWLLGLLSGTILWAFLINAAVLGGGKLNFILQLGQALGMGGPVFMITGAIAGIVYFFKRKTTTAMWTWTILLLVTLVVLGIGGAKQAVS